MGVVFRPTRFGFIPTEDEGVKIELNYDFIHTGNLSLQELTSDENKDIIIRVIIEYYELGKKIE